MFSLVLASASPRRRELLAAAGLEFAVAPVDVDENLAAFREPEAAALELAQRKAHAALEVWRIGRQALADSAADVLILGADTIVAVPQSTGWVLLGKPEDEADAARMLAMLSGSRHMVATGVAVVRAGDGALRTGIERTFVSMREITPAERADYVASGEWQGKAGGYAIQETADRFVVRLEEGGLDNVVGLPVALVQRLLAELASLPRLPRPPVA